MTISYSNPAAVHAPLGLYSHTVSVPEGTELRLQGVTEMQFGRQGSSTLALIDRHRRLSSCRNWLTRPGSSRSKLSLQKKHFLRATATGEQSGVRVSARGSSACDQL